MAFSRLLGTGLQFLAQLAVGRILGPGAVGILGATQSHILLFGGAAGVGVPEFVQRRTAGARGPHKAAITRRWLRLGLIASILGGGLGSLLFAIYWFALPMGGSNGHLVLGVTTAVGICLYAVGRVHIEFLKGQGLAARSLTLEFTFVHLSVLAAAVLCLVLPRLAGSEMLPAIAFAAYYGVVATLLVRHSDIEGIGLNSLGRVLRQMRANSGELSSFMITQVGNQATGALPTILVFALAGPHAAGLQVIVLKLLGLIGTVSGIFSAYFISPVATAIRARDTQKIRRLYLATMISNGGVSGALCLLMIAIPELIIGVFGEEFASPDAIMALRIGAGIVLVRQFTGISAIFLNLSGLARLDVVSHLIALSALVGGLVLLAVAGLIDDLVLVTSVVAVSGLLRPAISAVFVVTSTGLWRKR